MRLCRVFFSASLIIIVFIISAASNLDLFNLTENDYNQKLTSPISRSFAIFKAQVFHDYTVHYLLPFTKNSDLIPCKDYFNQSENFKKALDCSNKNVFSASPLINPPEPACYIVKSSSPDVQESSDGSYNYVSTSILLLERILGFYEDSNKTLFIVETYDSEAVYRHELQHYFLDLEEGDANSAHDHKIWQVCEPSYYEPSSEALLKGLSKKSHLQ